MRNLLLWNQTNSFEKVARVSKSQKMVRNKVKDIKKLEQRKWSLVFYFVLQILKLTNENFGEIKKFHGTFKMSQSFEKIPFFHLRKAKETIRIT